MDEPLFAIQQTAIKKLHEHVEDGLGKTLIHGVAFIGPIHRRTKAAELAGNFAAAFFFPLPDPGDELIAREISALLTLGVHLPLNHHLRGDARMISANHPQRILAAQPFITDHDILKCIRSEEHTSELQSLMRLSYAVFCLKTKK